MALPGLKDLLPDHLFYDSSSSQRPPPPPSSILQHVRLSEPFYAASASHGTPYPSTPSNPMPTMYRQALAYEPPPLPPSPQSAFRHRPQYIDRSTPLSDARTSGFTINDRRASPIEIRTFLVEPHEHESGSPDADSEKQSGVNERYKKHNCPECGKRFNRPSSLRIHLNTHTGAKPYVCPFPGCSRSFNVSSNMRRHYRNHAQRAPLPLQDDTVYAHWPVLPTQIAPVQVPCPAGPYDRAVLPVLPGEGQTPPPLQLKAAVTPQEREDHRVALADAERRKVEEAAVTSGGASSGTTAIAENSSAVPPHDHDRSYAAKAKANGPPVVVAVDNVGAEYVYPCPPANGGSAYHAAPYLPPRSYPYTIYQQHPEHPYADNENHATIYPDASKLDSGASRYDPQESQQRHGSDVPVHSPNSSSSAYVTGPKGIPDSREERYAAREERPSVPPTPPYTNEAAFSPPVYMQNLAHPPSGPVHAPPSASTVYGYDPGYGYERDSAAYHADWRPRSPPDNSEYKASKPAYADSYSRGPSVPSTGENKVIVETSPKELIQQQPSPDTPSLHVPELHEDYPSRSRSLGGEGEHVRGEEIKEEEEEALLGSEKGTRGEEDAQPSRLPDRRSSLNIKAIVNPTEHSLEVVKSERQSRPPSSSLCRSKSPSTARSSPSPHERFNQLEKTQKEGAAEGDSNGKTNSHNRLVGTTPGAAPPPPYPLYKRRSSLLQDEEEGEEAAEAEAPCRGGGGGRTKKRRRV